MVRIHAGQFFNINDLQKYVHSLKPVRSIAQLTIADFLYDR
jgi:hypothetical protein